MFGRKKKNIPKKIVAIIVIVLIIIIIVLLSLTLKDDRKNSKFESLLKDAFVSVEKVITFPIKFVTYKVKGYVELKKVEENNDILETSIDRVSSLEAENIELRREIEKMKEELNINYTLSDYEYLNASIVNRNVGFWYNTVTIDKGSYSGIKKDMVVINAKGLIGRIIKVSTFTSEVRLITTSETNNKISVHISNGSNDLYGLINSYNYSNNLLEVEGISNTKDVTIGDYVYTSGLGGIFPSGILIGTVTEISSDSYDLSKIIKVVPSVDFTDMNYVSVLKRKDSNDN